MNWTNGDRDRVAEVLEVLQREGELSPHARAYLDALATGIRRDLDVLGLRELPSQLPQACR